MDENKPVVTEEEEEEKNLKQKLADSEKALERTTRLLEKSQAYNEELRQQIEKLCAELHTYRSAAQNRTEAECQVDEKQIAEAFGDKPFPEWGFPNESDQTSEGAVENGVSIADSLKAAAQEVVWEQAGFVYDSASGLYYDNNSGYYYDSARSLYYDPSSTAYYYYDESEQTYKFHSYATGQHGAEPSHTSAQPATEAESSQNDVFTTSEHAKKKSGHSREKSHKHNHKEKPKVKEGSPLTQQSLDTLTSDLQKLDIQTCRRNALEISASYPPCIRVIVQASDTVDEGTFFLVTCPGGTIGREGDSRHAIHIPDINISKVHADIKYDTDNGCYTVEDVGSQNGTFLNDLRISESKEKSAAIPLSHGDVLRVGGSQILLHIHPGTDTCDLCEPGQVLAALRAQQTVFNDHVALSKREKRKQARDQLKEIKKKYGLANSAYVDNMEAIKHPDYADKAEMRRRFVGSEHPSHQKSHEAPASVHRPLSSKNKGHRMLAKMGWKEGSGLGKDNAGRAEPVTVELRPQPTAGLGSTSSVGVSLDNVQSAARMRRLVQTQERYHRLESSSASPSNSANDGGRTGEKNSVRSEGGRNRTWVNSGDSQGRGGASDSHSAKGPKRMEIKWIQGKTHKAT